MTVDETERSPSAARIPGVSAPAERELPSTVHRAAFLLGLLTLALVVVRSAR